MLGRQRALWCRMRRWRSMLHAAAKQCVQTPPLVLLVVQLLCGFCLCLRSVFCVYIVFLSLSRSLSLSLSLSIVTSLSVSVLHVACCSQAIHMRSSRYAEQPRTQEFATQKHGRDALRMSAFAWRRIEWLSSSSSSSFELLPRTRERERARMGWEAGKPGRSWNFCVVTLVRRGLDTPFSVHPRAVWDKSCLSLMFRAPTGFHAPCPCAYACVTE